MNKALPEIIAIFGDLSNHWLKSESYSKRNINNLVFPEGFSFTLDEKITTPKLSIPFNDLKENYESKSNLVDQVSRNWNTYNSTFLSWKEHLQNVQYIYKTQQYQCDYYAGVVDY